MKISIIIPAYNEEDFIESSVKAALSQNYPDFEVIVVNNASTDRTAELAGSLGAKVVTELKKGLTFARERGRLEASGEIIADMDADCLPGRDWLSKGAAFFADPEVVAVSGPYDYHDASPSVRKLYLWYQRHIQSLGVMNVFMGRGWKGGWITGGNALIRAEALRSVGGYDTSFEFWGEDAVTAKLLSKIGTVIFDKDFIMRTSGRRFARPGNSVFKVSLKYILYAVYSIFHSKPKDKLKPRGLQRPF